MKAIRKALLLLALLLSLALVLLSCTGNAHDQAGDKWMSEDVEVDTSLHYARPQQFADSGNSAVQSGNRVELPTVPVD